MEQRAVERRGDRPGLHDGPHGFHVPSSGDATDGCKSAGSHSSRMAPITADLRREGVLEILGNVEAHGSSAKVDTRGKNDQLDWQGHIVDTDGPPKKTTMTKDADPVPAWPVGHWVGKGLNGDDAEGKWTTMTLSSAEKKIM